MDRRPKILDLLRHVNDFAADEALIAAVPHVNPAYQREIIGLLLERGHEVGLNALPVLYDRLDDPTRAQIVAGIPRLFSALRINIRHRRGQPRLNTLEIIRRGNCLRLSYLVAYALRDGSPTVRAEAAATLLELTETYCESYAETIALLREATEPDGLLAHAIVQVLRLLCEERRHLLSAIREALGGYESHHRAEVIKAAMFLADELESDLFHQSTLKLGKLTHGMLEVFGSTPSPRLAPFTYVALCYPELRRRIVPILAACRDSAFFAEFVRYHWLARDPTIRRNLVSIRDLGWLGDGLDAAFSLPQSVAPCAPGCLLSLGLSSDRKVSALLNFLLIDNLPANRAAVWALVRINTPASTLALQNVLDHEDPDLVAVAQREIEHRQRCEFSPGRRPRSDRPEAWTILLEKAGLSESFDDIWQHFDRLHPVWARSGGPYALKYIPGFLTQIQIKLLSPHAPDRLRALKLVTALYLPSTFQKDIYNIANDPAPEVRAAAMTALGHVGDATSRRILERGLADDDPAVQAASVDAFDLIGAAHWASERILAKTESDHPEVRAAAVRTLLKHQVHAAVSALLKMLKDLRPAHRCAGLWVVDQLRLVSVLFRVREMETADPDSRIARIAQHVAKRLHRLHPHAPIERPAPAARVGAAGGVGLRLAGGRPPSAATVRYGADVAAAIRKTPAPGSGAARPDECP